ncbi:hypothetical protein [Streptomyces sp. CMSTAAHL-2]|uniref:hypothetical protein n=1 Tax=Streptomyces sp. CMSTAAHL-2 TaxID=2904522 RepID=UPI001E3A48CC|nr:hypothetical protein [Streptomyces sp. CMSTAAHL-2]MCE3031780.1 hypothetical protein [Streptomyces sp. CMSTAAHL-2]
MPMPTRTRALKFTAVLAFVVLSLTGFSRGGHSSHGHSYGHSHGGGGGGCSSSHQDHDTSSSSSSSSASGGGSYDDTGDDSYVSGGTASTSTTGGTGGTYRHRPTHTTTPSASSGGGLQDGRVTLISCAGAKKPYATVQLTNPNGRRATFSVEVSFQDRDGTELDFNDKDVTVPANGTVRAEVAYDAGYSPDLPDHCEVEPRAGVEG